MPKKATNKKNNIIYITTNYEILSTEKLWRDLFSSSF